MATTYTKLLYHVVFATKSRARLIKPNIESELYCYIGGIVRGEGGNLIEIGGVEDHVHMLTRFRANRSLADMMRRIKMNSSRWMNRRSNLGGSFAWQVGYGAFTVSPSQVALVRRYIQNQEEHHRVKSLREELIELLEAHGIQYDSRFLLDTTQS